jgi:hypothetical protein
MSSTAAAAQRWGFAQPFAPLAGPSLKRLFWQPIFIRAPSCNFQTILNKTSKYEQYFTIKERI